MIAAHDRIIASIRYHVFSPESNILRIIAFCALAISCALISGVFCWVFTIEIAFLTLNREMFFLAVLVEELRHGIGHYLSLITRIDPECHERRLNCCFLLLLLICQSNP